MLCVDLVSGDLAKLLYQFLKIILWTSLGFSPYTFMLPVKQASFVSSFSICVPLISISYLIVLARTSSMKLNRSGESVFPFLVSSLRKKVFNLSSLTLMLLCRCFFVDVFYQAEKVSQLAETFCFFSIKKQVFCQIPFLHSLI